MVWYGNSGAEAVEAGLKLARWHTKRPLALAFFGGFHGRTYGAVTLSGSKAKHREGFSPMLQGGRSCPVRVLLPLSPRSRTGNV